MHVVPWTRNSGNGISNAVVDLATAQAARGNDVTVLCGGGENVVLLRAGGVRVVLFPDPPVTTASIVRQTRSELRRLGAHRGNTIVHSHTVKTAAGAWLARARRRVVTMHNPYDRSSRWMFVLGGRVVMLADEIVDTFEDRWWFRFVRARTRVVHNGVIGSPRFSSPTPAELSHPAIVTVGGAYVRKGAGDLIAAMEVLPSDTHLYVMGGGADEARYRAEVDQRELADRVHLLGFRPDALDFIAAADVFVLASRAEGAALVIAEARMLGKAVIASTAGGIPSMLKPAAGATFPPGDVAALTDLLRMALTDSAFVKRLEAASLEGLNHYSTDRVAADMATIYLELSR